MTFPGKVTMRVFQLTLRNCILKNRRNCSVFIRSICYNGHKFDTTGIMNNKCGITSKISRISQVRTMGALSPLDPSSFSRPELAIIKHISLSLDIKFEEKVLNGSALLHFDVLKDIDNVVLDVSNLNIKSIEAEDGSKLEYSIGETLPNYGSKLTINLPKPAASGGNRCENKLSEESKTESCQITSKPMILTFDGFVYEPVLNEEDMIHVIKTENIIDNVNVDHKTVKKVDSCDCCKCIGRNIVYDGTRLKIKINYNTSPNASALQWLDPNQTSGKKHPYLFSQCQPIHARSIMPCQDTPAVKFTYESEITAPDQFTVLMSALRGTASGNKTTFRQPMPLPSYLVAIAAGVLESRTLGPRSRVWSEKEEIERSAWEFADTEKYLQAAERLCGPYEWTEYDLLVLPPSFPYGGMENPCLTFVTPTLLAGDRSQADVIVHEIMHSWTGNLVTNRNFEHFWLNEGFTVFLERKVGASLIEDAAEAKRSRDFHSLLGLQELSESINHHLGPTNALTRLVPDLNGVHPDDAFSRVPYEKGSLFLRYIEDLTGGPEVFDDFLRSYLTKFSKKSLDTDQFKHYLLDYFKGNGNLSSIDWDTWLYKSGMPPVIPSYDTSMTKAVTSLVASITEDNTPLTRADVSTFTPHQMINFLQELIDRPPLSIDKLASVAKICGLTTSHNSEIQYRWLRLCVRSKDQSKLEDVFNFVNQQGRMKYVRPLYRDLYAWEEVRKQAIDNFLKNEKYMMHVSAYTLRKDLHLDE